MIRRLSVAVALCVVAGCAREVRDPVSQSESDLANGAVAAASFAGSWRSVTPTLEFVRLTVDSKSSEQGGLAARLTLSGVIWEGSGRVEQGSFVASMMLPGAATPGLTMTAQAADAATLRVQLRTTSGETTALTFVRGE